MSKSSSLEYSFSISSIIFSSYIFSSYIISSISLFNLLLLLESCNILLCIDIFKSDISCTEAFKIASHIDSSISFNSSLDISSSCSNVSSTVILFSIVSGILDLVKNEVYSFFDELSLLCIGRSISSFDHLLCLRLSKFS